MVPKKRHYVLKYHDVLLEEEDMETLEENAWLNDNILSFYLEYAEHELIPKDVNDTLLLLRPTMVQLVTYYPGTPSDLISALPPHFDKRQYIFAPINNGTPETANNGTHWSLLVYSRPTNTFYHYDSLHATNIQKAKYTAKRMTSLLGTHKSPKKVQSPTTAQQDNGADCGLMVIGFMDCLIKQILASDDKTMVKLDASSKMVLSPNETRTWLKSLVHQLQPLKKSLSPKRILAKLV